MTRRMISMVLSLVLALTVCACAQAELALPQDFYELDEGQSVLTVRLPANPTTGYEWSCEISDAQLLKMDASEYIPDEVAEGVVGSGGMWVASFSDAITEEGMGGRVTLTLRYIRPFEQGSPEPVMGCALDIWVDESGQLAVDGIWRLENVESLAP